MSGHPRWPSDLLRLLLGCVLFLGAAALVLYLRLPRPFVWIWLAALLREQSGRLSPFVGLRLTT